MARSDSTCWTLVEGAARGDAGLREDFARRYEPVIRAYLGARWRRSPLAGELDDTVQDVFVELLKPGGALDRCDQESGGFRALLYAVARNVARRAEQGRRGEGPSAGGDAEPAGRDATLSAVFDRAWAQEVLRDARERQQERARLWGAAAERRVELLTLRFEQGRSIAEIARLWGTDAAQLHREYQKARTEFREALREAVAFCRPCRGADLDAECLALLDLLATGP